jgi:hypothetical protein
VNHDQLVALLERERISGLPVRDLPDGLAAPPGQISHVHDLPVESAVGGWAPGELGAGSAYVPGDELAEDPAAVAHTHNASEGIPQAALDSDGLAWRLLGVRHTALPVMTPTRVTRVAGVMTPRYDSVMTPQPPDGPADLLLRLAHETCRHNLYGMTCGQYESLVSEAGNRCQACGLHALENPLQKLFIDHDYAHGYWAVRGLLCNRCNTILGVDRNIGRNPGLASYLADPWYVRMLAEQGLGPVIPDEPPVGSVVTPRTRALPRRRTRKGWAVERKWHMGIRSWHELYRLWGPHNLIVTSK